MTNFESSFFEKLSEQTKIPIETLQNIFKFELDDVYLEKKLKEDSDGADEILTILTVRSLGMEVHNTRLLHLEDSLKLSKIKVWNLDKIIDSMQDHVKISGAMGSLNRHYDLTSVGMEKGKEILRSLCKHSR